MVSIWFEFSFILLLILANGFFAGAELSIVSVRRGRIAQLASAGNKRAQIVEQLQSDPHRFLATVQIGVTLVGTLASAVGGATAVQYLTPLLQQVPIPHVQNAAGPLAMALVVGLIAYLSLIFGELVPKALALEHAETMALRVARTINLLSRIGGVAVAFLTVSSRVVLAIFGLRVAGKQAFITKEEVQHLVAEARESGTVTPTEHDFIRNIFDFAHTHVSEVMVPRPRIVGLNLDRPREEILRVVVETQYSRFPVYRRDVENILGFVHGKDILGRVATNVPFDLEGLIRPPLFVPEAKKINSLLREMQRKRIHMAFVVDEYGGLSGLVTTEDLLEELVGEIEDEHDLGEPKPIQRLPDGGYLIDAMVSLNDLKDHLPLPLGEELPYETLAGLILRELGHIPEKGEQIKFAGYVLTCEEVTPTAIIRVRVTPERT